MGKGGGETTRVEGPTFLRRKLPGIAEEAQRLFEQGPLSFFPGQTFAGFDPLQEEAFQQATAFGRGAAPGLVGQAFGGLGQALNTDVTQDPSVQAALGTIESQALRNFQENVLPSIRQGATGVGGEFGSRLDQAERLAARDLQQGISESQSQFLANQLGSARQLQGVGLSLAPGLIGGLGTLPGNILGQVGAQRQGMEQQAINEAMQRFQFEQQAPFESLQTFANQLTGIGAVPGQTQTTSGGEVNPIAGGLGGAIGGATLGATAIPGSFATLGSLLSVIPGGQFALPILGGLLGAGAFG